MYFHITNHKNKRKEISTLITVMIIMRMVRRIQKILSKTKKNKRNKKEGIEKAHEEQANPRMEEVCIKQSKCVEFNKRKGTKTRNDTRVNFQIKWYRMKMNKNAMPSM